MSFHVDRPSHSWDTAIPKFDVENSRSMSWVRSKLKVTTWVQHSVDSHPFRSMSIGHPIPELWLFKKFDLENQGSSLWVRSQFKVTMWVQHSIDSHPFRSLSIGPPIPEIQHFQNMTLKIHGQGQMTMMLQNSKSRHFHRTSNGINHPAVSEIWVSQNLAQMLLDLTSFWPMGKPIWGKWANDHDSAQQQA